MKIVQQPSAKSRRHPRLLTKHRLQTRYFMTPRLLRRLYIKAAAGLRRSLSFLIDLRHERRRATLLRAKLLLTGSGLRTSCVRILPWNRHTWADRRLNVKRSRNRDRVERTGVLRISHPLIPVWTIACSQAATADVSNQADRSYLGFCRSDPPSTLKARLSPR